MLNLSESINTANENSDSDDNYVKDNDKNDILSFSKEPLFS